MEEAVVGAARTADSRSLVQPEIVVEGVPVARREEVFFAFR